MSGNNSDEDVAVGDRGVNPRVIIGLVIIIALLIFVFQNTQDTRFTFLWMALEMPMWGLALSLFGGGFITGWLMHLRRAKRKSAR